MRHNTTVVLRGRAGRGISDGNCNTGTRQELWCIAVQFALVTAMPQSNEILDKRSQTSDEHNEQLITSTTDCSEHFWYCENYLYV